MNLYSLHKQTERVNNFTGTITEGELLSNLVIRLSVVGKKNKNNNKQASMVNRVVRGVSGQALQEVQCVQKTLQKICILIFSLKRSLRSSK